MKMNHKNGRNMPKFWLLSGLIAFCGIWAQASTLPPDPDNAGLLYYQAFLLRPEADEVEKELAYSNRLDEISAILQGGELDGYTNIDERIAELEEAIKNRDVEPNELSPCTEYDMNFEPYSYEEKTLLRLRERQKNLRGEDPNTKLRRYLKSCRHAIEMAEIASEIDECDWGIMYSRGYGRRAPQSPEIRQLAFLLRADALRLDADGEHRAAFERCLMIRWFAKHVGDSNQNLYLMSIAVDSLALSGVRFLLTSVKPNEETLTWLKHELAARKVSSQSFVNVMNRDFEITIHTLHANRKVLNYVRDEFMEKAPDDAARQKIQAMTDEKFIALAEKPYAAFLNSAIQVIDSKITYEQKRTQIENLASNLESEHGDIGVTRMMLMPGSDVLLRVYKIHVRHKAYFSAIMSAIEILLIHARTGRLPEEFPDDSPKDPFTGQPFRYERADDAFVLICPDEVFQRQGGLSLEFKVNK